MTVELDPAPVTEPRRAPAPASAPPSGLLAEVASFGVIAALALLGLALLPRDLPLPGELSAELGGARAVADEGTAAQAHVPTAPVPLWALPMLDEAAPEPVKRRAGSSAVAAVDADWRRVPLVTRNLLFRPRVRLTSGSLHLVEHDGSCLVDAALTVENAKRSAVQIQVTLTSDELPRTVLGTVRATAPAGGVARVSISSALALAACPGATQAVASLEEVHVVR